MKRRAFLTAVGASLGFPHIVRAARQFNGTSQYINVATSHSVPITIAAWVYPDSVSVAAAVGSITSGANTRVHLGMSSTGNPVAVTVNTGGTTATATGTSTMSTGTWYHLVATFASSTDRKVYFNGTQDGSNTTAITLGIVDRTTIGMRVASNAAGLFWPGRIAEFATWGAALSDVEIASLAAGARPTKVRPGSLRLYVPMPGEVAPEPNWLGTSGTLTNAPTQISHPRVY